MKYNLIRNIFTHPNEYIDFLVNKSEIHVATEDSKCMASLTKEDGYLLYILTWIENQKYVGDYVILFKATQENFDKFNLGCSIIADRLQIYLETNDIKEVPENTPAFGDLTHITR